LDIKKGHHLFQLNSYIYLFAHTRTSENNATPRIFYDHHLSNY